MLAVADKALDEDTLFVNLHAVGPEAWVRLALAVVGRLGRRGAHGVVKA